MTKHFAQGQQANRGTLLLLALSTAIKGRKITSGMSLFFRRFGLIVKSLDYHRLMGYISSIITVGLLVHRAAAFTLETEVLKADKLGLVHRPKVFAE